MARRLSHLDRRGGRRDNSRTSLSTERIARACARRPWTTIGAWALALLLSAATCAAVLGDVLTSSGEITSNPESEQGYAAIGRHFPPTPGEEYVNELIVVRSDEAAVDDAAFREKVETLMAEMRSSGAVHNAESWYETQDSALVAPSRRAIVIPVGIAGDPEDSADRLVGIVQAADGGGFDVTITGEWTLDRDVNELVVHDLKVGELYFGLPAALIILVLVFGAVVAAVVPLVVAIFSILVALGLSALVGQAFDLSVYLVNMLTVMGLAIATDYGLFILSRYREERARGRAEIEAIAAAGGTASRAVLFSGLAFVLAMAGLLLIPDTVLRSLGVGALAVGLTSVVAALTLLPALLSLLGDGVNRLRIPLLGRTVESAGREGRFWSAIAGAVMRRPVVSVILSAGVLVAAAAPVLDLRMSTSGVRALPDGLPSQEGFEALEQEFGVGTADSACSTCSPWGPPTG